MRILLWAFVFILSAADARARVFDFTKTSLSTYFGGSFGLNKMQKYAYQPGFPPAVSFPDSDGVNQNYSGELGFAMASAKMTTRLGLQLLYPQLTSGLAGKNAAGTSLMSVNSQVYALIPKLDLEFVVKQNQSFKVFFGLGAGYAFVTMKNSVNLTAAGRGTYPVNDYTEAGTANAVMGEGYVGFEVSLFDNVGFSLDTGYQYLPVNLVTASQGTTTVIGTETTGGAITNVDGTNRMFDLSNIFAAAAFRVYFY